jgi:hypothetical protein
MLRHFRLKNPIQHPTHTNVKTTIRLSALALLALGSATLASAVTLGTTATFTLALTLSSTVGGFPKNVDDPFWNYPTPKGSVSIEEYKSAVVVSRVGVKEVLQDMIDNDEILGPISGWSIISVTVTDEFGIEDDDLFAVKKGQPSVVVESTSDIIASAMTISQKSISDSVKETIIFTNSGSIKTAQTFTLRGYEMKGIATGTYKLVSGKLKVGIENIDYELSVNGAAAIKSITGGFIDESGDGGEEFVIEGSASLAAAKVADIESFVGSFTSTNQ